VPTEGVTPQNSVCPQRAEEIGLQRLAGARVRITSNAEADTHKQGLNLEAPGVDAPNEKTGSQPETQQPA
jgi:hypothetical protein